MIINQAVKCPYCGYERNHAWQPSLHSNEQAAVAICEQTGLHKGCGRQFVLYWHLCAVTQTRKIEGQEEQRAAE